MPGPQINVGVDPQMLAAIGEYQNAVKAASQNTKLLEREIASVSAQGKEVSKELSDSLSKSYRDLDKYKDLARAQKNGASAQGISGGPSLVSQKEGFSRQFEEQWSRKVSQFQAQNRGTDFGRGDVRHVLGAAHLLEGKASVHSIHNAIDLLGNTSFGQRIGAAKLGEIMSNVAGPAMVGQMLIQEAINSFQAKTDFIATHATNQASLIDTAEKLGIGGTVRKSAEAAVIARVRAKIKKTGGETEAQEFDDPGDEMLSEADVTKQEATLLEQIGHARKFYQLFGGSPAFLKRRAARIFHTKDLNTEQLNQAMDDMLKTDLLTNEGQAIYARQVAHEKEIRRDKLQHEMRMQWDPEYVVMWRTNEAHQKYNEERILTEKQQWNEQ